MSSLLAFVLSAPGAITTLALAALWLTARPASRARRFLCAALAIGYLLATIYAVPYSVSRVLLVRGFRELTAADVPAGRTVVVLLSGGGMTVHGTTANLPMLNEASAVRTLEAYRVYTLLHADAIISSGGLSDPSENSVPSSIMMRDALVRLGVPSSRILLELESSDTRDEAVIVERMLRPMGADHVVLVTSDIHMKRSVGAFRAVGWEVIPTIAREPRAADPLSHWITPTSYGLVFTLEVTHELMGIAYYTARGWAK